MGLPSSPSVKPKEVEKDTEKKTRGNPGKIPPHPLPKKKKKKWQGGDFLVKFQMQLCRTKGENDTCNYLGFKSSLQIALILWTLFSCHILFSLQQVYKLFGLQPGITVQTLGAEFR